MDGSMTAPDWLSVLQMAAQGVNLADILPEERLARIGDEAVRLYRLDRDSMKDWLDAMDRGIKLAKLVKTEKNYPWPNAANVKYPLITTASLQFNARAYPAIVASDQVVRVKTFGSDPQGRKAARAKRVAEHLSWQLIHRIDEWEEETDRLLAQLPIVGTMVRKVWYDPVAARPRCRLIAPGAFIVNCNVKTLDDAPRQTEEMALYPDEIATRRRSGQFRDTDYLEPDGEDEQAAQDFIEQHCRLDLDEDGYDEPYIVTVHCKSGKVARIVGDFSMEDVAAGPQGVVSIRRNSYFVPYHFLPSMDGSFFGTGLGVLLGDTSDTINSILNMMMDAGHAASLGGGFIGSEFRIKGGSQRMRPGEWRLTQSKGVDIKNSIVPLTFPGPDAVLFQLLGLLIEAGKEVASVKDVLMGETGGRNMTATTTLALIEQGMMQFTAAYKRIFRSLRREYGLFARINAATVSPQEYSQFHDVADPQTGQPVMLDPRADYSAADMDIAPMADPRSVTRMQEAAKAQLIMEMAQAGMVNPQEASRRMIEAASISDADALLPQPDPMQQAMAQMQMASAEADVAQKRVDIDLTLARIESERASAMKDLAGIDAERRAQQLDLMKTILEERRARLDAVLGARTDGMAGQPGGAGGARRPDPFAGTGAGGGAGGLLAGAGMAGGSPLGLPPGGGAAGGLV